MTISNVKMKYKDVSRLYRGDELLWGEVWTTKTGNLVTMTSNSAPSPYTIEVLGNGAITSGNAYHIFDNNASTTISTNVSGLKYTIIKLNFGKKIRIKKIYINSGSSLNTSDPTDKGIMITTNATSETDLGTTLVELSGEYSSGTTGVTKDCLQPNLATDNICFVVVQTGHTLTMRGCMITEWEERE